MKNFAFYDDHDVVMNEDNDVWLLILIIPDFYQIYYFLASKKLF